MGGIAKALRWATIPPIDWLGLDVSYVLRRDEAKAIADPLSRLLWPYLRQINLLTKLLEKAEEGSDGYLLLLALYQYVERVGMGVMQAYFYKLEAIRAYHAVTGIHPQPIRQQQQTSSSSGGGNSEHSGPSGILGAFLRSSGSDGSKPNTRAAAGAAARSAGTDGPAVAPESVGSLPDTGSAHPAEPAMAGPWGIGERLRWNGGPFGATSAFEPAPGVAEPLESWSS